MLRTTRVLAAVAVLLGASAALAQRTKVEPKVAGDYEVKFDEVSNNCQDTGMSLKTATVSLSQGSSRRIEVSLQMVPVLRGVVAKGGKFKAEAKKGKTAIEGVDGRFSIAGRVTDQGLQLLLIAEYFQGDKPLCTQSWNGSGPRK